MLPPDFLYLFTRGANHGGDSAAATPCDTPFCCLNVLKLLFSHCFLFFAYQWRLDVVYLNFETHLVVYFKSPGFSVFVFLHAGSVTAIRAKFNSIKSNLQIWLVFPPVLLPITLWRHENTYNPIPISKYHKIYLATFHHVTVCFGNKSFDI